jgi:hypothetical protein
MNYLLNLLAVLVFFINRFFFRKKKTAPFNWRFWISDNWAELIMIIILNLMFMLLMNTEEATKALENLPPAASWIYFFGKPGLSIVIGLGLSWGAYGIISKKVKELNK